MVAERHGTVHSSVQVVERGSVRFMRFGQQGGWQGAVDFSRQDRPVFAYQRAFLSLLQTLPTAASFLALGVGSGTALAAVQQQFPACSLYGLELDSVVLDMAIGYFGCPSHTDATYWVGDGVLFLCNTDLQVDFMFVDAYLSNKVYSSCLDPLFPAVLNAATTEQGVVVCNLIASLPLSGRVRTFLAAAREQFASVLLLPVGAPLPYAEQNILVVMSKDPELTEPWRRQIRDAGMGCGWERWLWSRRIRTVHEAL